MGVIRILLVDDHVVVRQALRRLLDAEPGFTVVGEAGDLLQAERLATREHPDVVISDLVMPGLGGLELTRRLARRSPTARVVILSMHDGDEAAIEALRAGASAYVTKSAVADDLFTAVREAAAGRRFLSAPLSLRAIESALQSDAPRPADAYESLTDREREVLQFAAEGLSSSAIAERLFISPRTAETHRANVMRKLSLHNQTELILYAIREGLLSIGAPGEPPREGPAARSARVRPRAARARRTRR